MVIIFFIHKSTHTHAKETYLGTKKLFGTLHVRKYPAESAQIQHTRSSLYDEEM